MPIVLFVGQPKKKGGEPTAPHGCGIPGPGRGRGGHVVVGVETFRVAHPVPSFRLATAALSSRK